VRSKDDAGAEAGVDVEASMDAGVDVGETTSPAAATASRCNTMSDVRQGQTDLSGKTRLLELGHQNRHPPGLLVRR
jgi:hypothetical protein